MTKVKAHLEGPDGKEMPVELQIGETVTIGHANPTAAEGPDVDLGKLMPGEALESVAVRHGELTYEDGDFRIATVDKNEIFIGQYVVAPGHFLRVVDGDRLRFGEVEVIFHIDKLGETPSPVTRASVES
jgi:hypothetical protein